ncbi:hypothetical protein BD769DRAFT_1393755 [Suillus cothurnatus]|nr:hypothetical protein BD769DRAFT_1393755 [Suillus cothurnatus]
MGNKTRGQKRSRDNLVLARASKKRKNTSVLCSVTEKDENASDSAAAMSTSIDIDDVMTPYPGPCIQHPPSGNLEHVTSAHFKTVQCEEVEDEDDLIAIRGVRWQENDYLQTGILEEITDLPEVISHDCYGAHEIVDDFVDDDETDAASEDGEKRDYSFELRKPPTIEEARKALDSLQQLLKPPRKDKTGYKDPKLPPVLKERLMLARMGELTQRILLGDTGNLPLIELHEMHEEERVPRETICLAVFGTGRRHILATEKHYRSVTHLANSRGSTMRV